jgi:hypothetical protein
MNMLERIDYQCFVFSSIDKTVPTSQMIEPHDPLQTLRGQKNILFLLSLRSRWVCCPKSLTSDYYACSLQTTELKTNNPHQRSDQYQHNLMRLSKRNLPRDKQVRLLPDFDGYNRSSVV